MAVAVANQFVDLESPELGLFGPLPLDQWYPRAAPHVDPRITLVPEPDVLAMARGEEVREKVGGGPSNLGAVRQFLQQRLRSDREPPFFVSLNSLSWQVEFPSNEQSWAKLTLEAWAWTSFDASGDHSLWRVELEGCKDEKNRRFLLVRLRQADISSGMVKICDGSSELDPETALAALQPHLLPYQKCRLTLQGLGPSGYRLPIR